MHKQCKFPVGVSICFSYDCIGSTFKGSVVFGIQKNGTSWFNQQCPKHAMLLM